MIMMIIITIICNSITYLSYNATFNAGSVFVYIFMYVHTNVHLKGLIHLLHKKQIEELILLFPTSISILN